MKKKIKKKLKRSNGHVTVARGMGGEGSVGCVANGHMTVGRWGKGRGRGEGGGGGGGEGEERWGRGEEEREGGWGGGEEEREAGWGGGGGRRGPGGGPVEPAQHKARGLVTGLKKN